MSAGRRVPWWVLLVLLVVLPLAELWVLIQVGQVIGAWWTIALLLLMSVVGGWLLKREGTRAWRSLASTLSSGRMPARELADGALVVLGGALLLTPGFVTDAMGLLLILPGTRSLARAALTSAVTRRLLSTSPFPAAPRHGQHGGPGGDARHPGPGPDGPVVRGEVIDP